MELFGSQKLEYITCKGDYRKTPTDVSTTAKAQPGRLERFYVCTHCSKINSMYGHLGVRSWGGLTPYHVIVWFDWDPAEIQRRFQISLKWDNSITYIKVALLKKKKASNTNTGFLNGPNTNAFQGSLSRNSMFLERTPLLHGRSRPLKLPDRVKQWMDEPHLTVTWTRYFQNPYSQT